MLKKRTKIKLGRIIAYVMIITTMLSSSAFAMEKPEISEQTEKRKTWQEKIDAELWEVMAEKSDDDLIPVYLWLKDVDREIITNALINEKGMDPAIYENQEWFQDEIVSEITRQIEERVGYEEAHKVVPPEQMSADESVLDAEETAVSAKAAENSKNDDEAFFDQSISLVDRAISAKVDEYIIAKREITKREYSTANDDFIANNIGKKRREIIYNSRYTSTLTVEATKVEIEVYAKKEVVEEISLYVELIQEPSLNLSLGQIGADYSGTKGSGFNSGNGYRGTGIKIGIFEAAGGRFDSSAPQLSGAVSKSRLFYSNDAGILGTGIIPGPTVTNHATMVTSLVVGQSVTVSNRTYEGVVPLATVYQTPINNSADVQRGMQKLADKGCTVINFSAGSDTGMGYDSFDKEVDKIINNTGVTFVVAAGNNGGGTNNVNSPGKALDAITVGNAQTKSNATTASSSPYSILASSSTYPSGSSFDHASYLPNKPDISAPGTDISYVWSSGTIQTMYGTSFSAPLVTGVVAQMMQAQPWLKTFHTAIKSMLIIGAKPGDIRMESTPSPNTDSTNAFAGNHLWTKSGAGLVNAPNAVNAVKNSFGYGTFF